MSDLRQAIKAKIVEGYSAAKDAHKEINSEKCRIEVAIGYLSIASSFINAAHAIYLCNYQEHGRHDLDNLFFEFNKFIDEAMDNFREDHSHQWSGIEFINLSESYKEIASVLDIPFFEEN